MADTVQYVLCFFQAAHDLTTWPSGLDFGTRGPGSIPGWALITNCFSFLFLFSPCNANLLHTSRMELERAVD